MILKQVKDLSEYSEEERHDVARQILLKAPYTIDAETFKAYTASIKTAVENVAFCEHNIKELGEVIVQSAKVENLLHLAQEVLQTRSASFEFISKGFAWNMANESIRANDISNSYLNANLTTLLKTAENELGYAPSWYSEIVDCIQDITGIDIRVSEFN